MRVRTLRLQWRRRRTLRPQTIWMPFHGRRGPTSICGLLRCFDSHDLGRALQGRQRRCGERGGFDWRAPNGSWCNAVVDLLDRADIEARQIVTNPKNMETLRRLS